MKIIGYSVPMSVAPGDSIAFKISSEEASFDASLVRLVGGSTRGEAAPSKPVDIAGVGRFPCRKQDTRIGSFADLSLPKGVAVPDALTFQSWIFPTTAALDRKQTILGTDAGLELSLEGGKLVCSLGTQQCSTAGSLENQAWYFVVVRWPRTQLSLTVERLSGWTAARLKETVGCAVSEGPSARLTAIRLAASVGEPTENHFNGKIEGLRILARDATMDEIQGLRDSQGVAAPIFAHWSFDKDICSIDRVVDIGPHASHGRLHNLPTRAVTGHNWSGQVMNYAQDPSQYGAVAFHDDDLYDSGWETDVSLTIPKTFTSGVYALEVAAGGARDSIPFFVRAEAGSGKDVLFLAPTNTYLAYANERLANLDLSAVMEHELALNHNDRFILANSFIGKSLYDHHTDGTGVTYSSRLRPILNFRPTYMTWLTAAQGILLPTC